MDKAFLNDFNNIISYLSPRIQMYLKKLSEPMVENIQEIRIRANRPVVIVTANGSSFLTLSGKTSYIYSSNCVITTENEVFDSVTKMCGYSMHSHYEDILNGYISLPNGARVGIVGTAVYENENVKSIKDISCLNIRIPRNVNGVCEPLFSTVFKNNLTNLLIVGSPSSGKTTMLRDLAFQLSSGRLGKYYKICVVDERQELFPSQKSGDLLGPNTDVILGFPKEKGISMAVRTLSPDIIICDEIGGLDEADKIINGMNSGVRFALSIHADSIDELKRKEIFSKLVNAGVIENVVLLEGSDRPCKIKKIYKMDVDANEVVFNILDNDNKLYSVNVFHKAN